MCCSALALFLSCSFALLFSLFVLVSLSLSLLSTTVYLAVSNMNVRNVELGWWLENGLENNVENQVVVDHSKIEEDNEVCDEGEEGSRRKRKRVSGSRSVEGRGGGDRGGDRGGDTRDASATNQTEVVRIIHKYVMKVS